MSVRLQRCTIVWIASLILAHAVSAFPIEGFQVGSEFEEPPIGATAWISQGGELGFTSVVESVEEGPIHTVGVDDDNAGRRFFRFRNVHATTTFDSVAIPDGKRLAAHLRYEYPSKASWDAGERLRADVTNGTGSVTLGDVSGSDFYSVNVFQELTWLAPVPPEWTEATLQFEGRTGDPNERPRIEVHAAGFVEVLVPPRSSWRYFGPDADEPAGWQDPGFDDGAWPSGAAPVGWGSDVTTKASPGRPTSSRQAIWLRHDFVVEDAVSLRGLLVWLSAEDGAEVYLNGVLLVRDNLPPGELGVDTLASVDHVGVDYQTWHVPADALVEGENVLAAALYPATTNESAAHFDLALSPASAPAALALERPPYVQQQRPFRTTVRWRTNRPSETVLRYGRSPDALDIEIVIDGERFDHEVEIWPLFPTQRYFYEIGTRDIVLAGGDADHWLESAPVAGSRDAFRIWVTGDTGQCAQTAQGCIDARAVKQAYQAFAGATPADLWLSLGDMAYPDGKDDEFTRAFFEVYPDITRSTPMWPTIGNHEFGRGNVASSDLQRGPYYDAFTMPRKAEAGGVPSGTEAYYSFDRGNVHFVSIDSHASSRAGPADPVGDVCAPGQGSAMYQWLCADLAATTADFTIVFWHHPPYSKGSHDSDDCANDPRLCQMREIFVPVLEAFGVDLQLSGHEHSYQRSGLMDGHVGKSDTYSAGVHRVQPGSGNPDLDGAYEKSVPGPLPGSGAVYAVVGSSSKLTAFGEDFVPHAAMERTLETLGSMVIDVDGARLDAYFLDDEGAVRDRFRIDKGAPPTVDLAGNGESGASVETDGTLSVTLDMQANGETASLHWFLGLAVGGYQLWFTPDGSLSNDAVALASLPPVDIQQAPIIELGVHPDFPLSVVFLLYGENGIVAMDVISATAPPPE